MKAYADVYLADLFCSGIPLSTLDFGKDFTYAGLVDGASVHARRRSLRFGADARSGQRSRAQLRARGKGRALLALGKYADAAAAVSIVPDGFQYALLYDQAASPGPNDFYLNRSFAYAGLQRRSQGTFRRRWSTGKGMNGLPFMSSGDPRSAFVDDGTRQSRACRGSTPRSTPSMATGRVVIASGIEARLIQAEAALNGAAAEAGSTTLNTLRTDGTFETQPTRTSTKTDTLWHAGTGGVAGLKPLSDPVDPDARVDLVFSERGVLALSHGNAPGRSATPHSAIHRQAIASIRPVRIPAAFNTYGSDVTAPIPGEERISNPLFTGCSGPRSVT